MRILVTGGAGFIGTNLCKKLLSLGHQVIAVDNFITSDKKNIETLLSNPNLTFIKQDIIKPLAISNKPLAIQQIYHLACPTGVENLERLAEEMLLTCSLGTKNVLELAKNMGAKFLFTSSSEVYGDPKVSPQTEDYTGNVNSTGERSPYEEGKRFAESLVKMYTKKYQIDAKIVRVFNTYGPGMRLDDSRVIPAFLKQAFTGKPLTIHGKGSQRRTFCYVDDIVSGLILVMEEGKSGEVYNLGSTQQISILELARLIIKLTNLKGSVTYIPRPQHDHQARLPSLAKIKKIGWESKTNLKVGLKMIIQNSK